MGNVQALGEQILAGQRRALARAITLVESTRADHREQTIALLDFLQSSNRQAIRIGLSGTPGVGKSTFTESFGMMLAEQGFKVAVLAVDPSSTRTGGSILGDKTRMDRLSRHPNAFIRPSPSQTTLGGVARRSREAIRLCETAGYDVVIVETVGVGQSETMVADMTDIFLLLLAPAGGDELQGVKRGIMEIADLILVNKADGDLVTVAKRAVADYAGALRLLRKRNRDPEDFPKALAISALEEQGLNGVWKEITKLADWRKSQGVWQQNRQRQAVSWFEASLRQAVLDQLEANPTIRDLRVDLARQVKAATMNPEKAAAQVMTALKGS